MENNTLNEILEIVVFIKDHAVTKEEFDKEIKGINGEIKGIKGEIKGIKSSMVTKAYLDDKLAKQTGDLIVLLRKEDTKLRTLIEILAERRVLTEQDKMRIFSMEPFPELFLR